VLLDSKEIHFNALNLALNEVDNGYIISRKEQDTVFEGLTTNVKLDILTKTKGLPSDLHEDIWFRKQEYSAKLFESISKDEDLVDIFKFIKSRGVKIAVASNSIRKTLDTCLTSLGVINYVDYSLSNEDVKLPKPDPQIYNRCMDYLMVEPEETVIFEDSEIGLRSAFGTGAKVEKVINRKDIYFDRIDRIIHEA
jgi:beta-phosphoglucomutase-like phosphatase (HAD superfamily)